MGAYFLISKLISSTNLLASITFLATSSEKLNSLFRKLTNASSLLVLSIAGIKLELIIPIEAVFVKVVWKPFVGEPKLYVALAFGIMLELEVKTLGFEPGTFDVWLKM